MKVTLPVITSLIHCISLLEANLRYLLLELSKEIFHKSYKPDDLPVKSSYIIKVYLKIHNNNKFPTIKCQTDPKCKDHRYPTVG